MGIIKKYVHIKQSETSVLGVQPFILQQQFVNVILQNITQTSMLIYMQEAYLIGILVTLSKPENYRCFTIYTYGDIFNKVMREQTKEIHI